ncbi:hypothetical protein MRX96_017474 [Rhipicephalus microplus]
MQFYCHTIVFYWLRDAIIIVKSTGRAGVLGDGDACDAGIAGLFAWTLGEVNWEVDRDKSLDFVCALERDVDGAFKRDCPLFVSGVVDALFVDDGGVVLPISTVTASSTGPFPGAASAHPVAFLDARFSQAMRSPDFPACRPSGLRVRECLLDPPTAVSFDGRINWQLYKELDPRPPLWWAWDFGKDVHASGTLLLCCADLDRHCLIYQSFSRSRVCAPGSVPGHALQSNQAIT